MAERLVLEQREVVRRVVGDDRDAGIQQRAQRLDDLGDDLGGRSALGAGVLGRDAVDGGRALGDLDAGIGEPVARADDRARRASSSPTCAVTMRSRRHVDAGRLEIEHADDLDPVRALEERERLGLPQVHAAHGMRRLRHPPARRSAAARHS